MLEFVTRNHPGGEFVMNLRHLSQATNFVKALKEVQSNSGKGCTSGACMRKQRQKQQYLYSMGLVYLTPSYDSSPLFLQSLAHQYHAGQPGDTVVSVAEVRGNNKVLSSSFLKTHTTTSGSNVDKSGSLEKPVLLLVCGNPSDNLVYSVQYTGDMINPAAADVRRFVSSFVGTDSLSSNALHKACLELIDTVDVESQQEVLSLQRVLGVRGKASNHISRSVVKTQLQKKRTKELIHMMNVLNLSTLGISEKDSCIDSLLSYADSLKL